MTEATFLGWATLVAVLLGPIFAVLVTRKIDEERAAKARKLEIFRALMRTRGIRINNDHVAALNLIEIEFLNSKEVLKAWRTYLAHLSERLPETATTEDQNAVWQKRDNLLTRLLSQIAKSLKLNVDQIDILENSYTPQAWHDDENEQRMLRQSLIHVCTGQYPLSVRPFQQSQSNNNFPPPPK